MIEDRLNNGLLNMGYLRLNSNAQGIYLFYRAAENGLIVVSVIHAINGNEITAEQYEHILSQIKNNFTNASSGRIRLLSLVLTRYPDRVKHFCSASAEDSHWIIDLSSSRLMIYETQSDDFAGLKNVIEQLLSEEQNPLNQNTASGSQYEDGRDAGGQNVSGQYEGVPYGGGQYGGYPGAERDIRIKDALPFTLMNTIVIVINIIAYIMTHFTGAFGGADQMFYKGALSWHYVIADKQYYRILTSMFMHADWGHLVNNMIVLLFVGVNLERAAGKIRYLLIYFGTGIIAGFASIGYNMWRDNSVFAYKNATFSIGASGAIFGVVGAILYIVIINKGRLAQINTRQMVIFIILSLYSGIINSHIDQAAHIGGFLGGLLFAALLYRKRQRVQV